MNTTTIKVVDSNELFQAVKSKFPNSKAFEVFFLGAEYNTVRLFFTPENEKATYHERWEIEIFETLKETIGAGYDETIGIHFL